MHRLCVFLLFLSFNTLVHSVPAGHSMRLLTTYIMGETAFPEFTTVVMLDDVYVDPKTKTLNAIENLHEKIDPEIGYDFNSFSKIHNRIRSRLPIMLQHFNVTEGVHTYQHFVACQTSADEESDSIVVQESFNAIDLDSFHCNKTHYSHWTGNTWQSQWEENQLLLYRMILPNIYLPICIQSLHYALKLNKKLVLRRMPPRMRFLQKEIPGGARVSCLATDFYPRHINLTLRRDGKPVADHQLTGGSVLPNGNGLYQVRKSLELTSVELKERHNYTCVASHLSVDNKLEITWQPSRGRSYRLSVLSVPLLLGLLLALLLLVLGFLRIKRMRGKRQNADTMTSQPLQVSEDDNQTDASSLSET